MWMQVQGGWAVIRTTFFEHGGPVGMAMPQRAPVWSAVVGCTYARGKIVEGDPKTCLTPTFSS